MRTGTKNENRIRNLFAYCGAVYTAYVLVAYRHAYKPFAKAYYVAVLFRVAQAREHFGIAIGTHHFIFVVEE